MENNKSIKLRIPEALRKQILEDLKRPHSYAFERVGFVFTKQVETDDTTIVLFVDYRAVEDTNYIDDDSAGAVINSQAIRNAMQYAYDNGYGCFHVHHHSHTGYPSPSRTDLDSLPKVVEGLNNISPSMINGFIIFSNDSVSAHIKMHGHKKLCLPQSIAIVGYPTIFVFPGQVEKSSKKSSSRQSFLGENSQLLFENIRIGIVGYGGGGSHIGQQLAHIGITNLVIFDRDNFEDTNLNRLVGAQHSDIKDAPLKTTIAERTIKRILPSAEVTLINDWWENDPEKFYKCDIIVSTVDTYQTRSQIEADCRRHLMPMVDIGMDVYTTGKKPIHHQMSGQVILSMPGKHCMRCMGYLSDKKLAEEAGNYGDVGGRPQVVWPNGILASSAVGVVIDLITGWTKEYDKSVYLSYDGNKGTLTPHIRLEHLPESCRHYPLSDIGTPVFIKL